MSHNLQLSGEISSATIKAHEIAIKDAADFDLEIHQPDPDPVA